MTELAKRYGDSLYDLAAEEALDTELLGELAAVCDLLRENPDYLHLLSQPNLPKKERCSLLDEAFGGRVHPYILNFIKILCEEGTLRELQGCGRQYRLRYNRAHGIVQATAVSAVPLEPAARQKLAEKLAAMTGKTVDLTVRLDPGMLGGLRIDVDGTRYDGTVKARLETLRADLAGIVLS